MLQNCYDRLSGALLPAPVHAPARANASPLYIYARGELEAASCKLIYAREDKLQAEKIEGGNPMNKLLNNIRISDLPGYVILRGETLFLSSVFLGVHHIRKKKDF